MLRQYFLAAITNRFSPCFLNYAGRPTRKVRRPKNAKASQTAGQQKLCTPFYYGRERLRSSKSKTLRREFAAQRPVSEIRNYWSSIRAVQFSEPCPWQVNATLPLAGTATFVSDLHYSASAWSVDNARRQVSTIPCSRDTGHHHWPIHLCRAWVIP